MAFVQVSNIRCNIVVQYSVEGNIVVQYAVEGDGIGPGI